MTVAECAADPSLLTAFAETDRQKLLVIVIDGPLRDESWFSTWLQALPDRTVLTVFKGGASPPAWLPGDALKAVNAQLWKDSVTEVVPAILSLS